MASEQLLTEGNVAKLNRDAERELLERAVRAAAQWMFVLVDSLDQLSVPPGYRQLVDAMYQHMAIEHFKGIITLVADGLYTPARTLVKADKADDFER